MDSIFKRFLAIALLGLCMPLLIGWLPMPTLIVVVEVVLGAGLLAVPIVVVTFIVQTLVGGATSSPRRRY